jgi:catechol 2,3-dioxygenase-like lactoylglutathione lyase family enzyme
MTAPAETIAAKAVIAGVEPQLFVADILASCDFFVAQLGFTVVFTYGEPPYYAQVKRDSARLNLRCVDRPAIDPQFRDRAELLSATFVVSTPEEIEQLFLEFQESGVTFVQTLSRKPWGARDFIIRDIDGNLLLFAGPAE